MQHIEYEHIDFPLAAQFHVLVHFSSIDKAYDEMLIENGFNNAQIEAQLKEHRSKFDSGFAKNPDILWQKLAELSKKHSYQIIHKTGKELIIFKIPDEIVGVDNLYLLPVITEQKGFEKLDSQLKISKIYGSPMETNQVNCILKPIDDKYEIVTLFPGVYAPPFPDSEKQNMKDYSESNSFWKKHAIIINH